MAVVVMMARWDGGGGRCIPGNIGLAGQQCKAVPRRHILVVMQGVALAAVCVWVYV